MMLRNAFTFATAIFLIWMVSGPGQAGVAEKRFWHVRAISDQGVLTLADDRRVCLQGLWLGGMPPSVLQMAAVKLALDELIDGQPVQLDQDGEVSFDRYGCEVAKVETATGVSLQQTLLNRGLALVKPSPPATADEIEAWLALEVRARAAGRGLWGDQAALPRKASAMDDHIGETSLVEGRVVRVSENDRYVYLNFGQDWRTDFTVRLRQKMLKKNGIEPAGFDGKKLRIRGFVQQSRGPLIDISHLKQIEVMP